MKSQIRIGLVLLAALFAAQENNSAAPSAPGVQFCNATPIVMDGPLGTAMLTSGLYTALLAGLNNGTGIGLVKVYDRGAPLHERL